MKKKIIIGIISIGVIVFSIAFFIKYQKQQEYKKTIAKLPEVNLVDYALFKDAFYDEGDLNCLLMFNTECGFCLDEVEDIVDNIEFFEEVNFYLISNETEQSLVEYSEDSEFLGLENFTILKDDNELFSTYFDTSVTPSVFVYKKSGELIAYNHGFLPIEKLKLMISEEN